MFPVNEEIFRFEIPVNNVQLMQVSYTTDHLFKIPASFIFLNFGFLNDVIKQFSFLNVLHDKKKMPRSLNDLNLKKNTS